ENYQESVFSGIKQEFQAFATRLGFHDVEFIPISALAGDNCVHRSSRMPWYRGGTLLEYLECVPVHSHHNYGDLRFPVQYVLRPNLTSRGFAASIASGILKKGDTLLALPSGNQSRVVGIDTFSGELQAAYPPMSVSVRLEHE